MRDDLQANRDPMNGNPAPAFRDRSQQGDGYVSPVTKRAVQAVQAYQAQRVLAYLQRVLDEEAERRARGIQPAADATAATRSH